MVPGWCVKQTNNVTLATCKLAQLSHSFTMPECLTDVVAGTSISVPIVVPKIRETSAEPWELSRLKPASDGFSAFDQQFLGKATIQLIQLYTYFEIHFGIVLILPLK